MWQLNYDFCIPYVMDLIGRKPDHVACVYKGTYQPVHLFCQINAFVNLLHAEFQYSTRV